MNALSNLLWPRDLLDGVDNFRGVASRYGAFRAIEVLVRVQALGVGQCARGRKACGFRVGLCRRGRCYRGRWGDWLHNSCVVGHRT